MPRRALWPDSSKVPRFPSQAQRVGDYGNRAFVSVQEEQTKSNRFCSLQQDYTVRSPAKAWWSMS